MSAEPSRLDSLDPDTRQAMQTGIRREYGWHWEWERYRRPFGGFATRRVGYGKRLCYPCCGQCDEILTMGHPDGLAALEEFRKYSRVTPT